MAPSSLALRSHPQPPTQVGGLGTLRQQVQAYSLTFSLLSQFLLTLSQSGPEHQQPEGVWVSYKDAPVGLVLISSSSPCNRDHLPRLHHNPVSPGEPHAGF